MAETRRINVCAIEDTLLAGIQMFPMNWFGSIVIFRFVNKRLMMSCNGRRESSYNIGTDCAIYNALRKHSPKGLFRFDYELEEMADDMISRRTIKKGDIHEQVSERVY